MNNHTVQLHLGIGAMAASAFLILIAIPNWVTAPSNIPNIVLSPTFWPYVLSALTGLIGLGLILSSVREARDGPALNDPISDTFSAYVRLGVMAVFMLVIALGMSTVGMVWMSMAAFAATAFLVRTRHPIAAVICAVVLPLLLYAFFAHVAGVAIPQGIFLRLP